MPASLLIVSHELPGRNMSGPAIRYWHLDQLRRGDFFLCASQRQRDFWLGMLAAAGRVNPYTFAADPVLRRLIDVLPFGIPDDAPQRARPAIKGVVPGIGPDDQVVYWGGG